MNSILDKVRTLFSSSKFVVNQLIFIHVSIFAILFLFRVINSFGDDPFPLLSFALSNLELSAPIFEFITKPWTLVTYTFTHLGVFHILFNMLALYWFGNLLEEYIGATKVLHIFLLGGVLSGLFYVCIYNLLSYSTFSNVHSQLHGSSAAIYALLFAGATLIPNYEFFFFQRFAVKIKYLAFAALFLSFFDLSSGLSHAGGALVGFGYISLLRKGINLGAPISFFSRLFRRNPFKRKSTFDPRRSYSKSIVSKRMGVFQEEKKHFPDQEEVDAILDKISTSGYESLSKDEKHKLYLASQRKDE